MSTTKKLTLHCAIVVYNSIAEKTETFQRIAAVEQEPCKVLILDNSDDVQYAEVNERHSRDKSYAYISMNGNMGLSKAYNAALDYLVQSALEDDLVIWFDDDSLVSDDYFSVLRKSATDNEAVDIFAPVIQGQDGRFYSPNEAHLIKNKQLKEPGDCISNKRFNAINSCTAVRMRCYKEYRYDEKIFLDQVDHAFFEDQRAMGRLFYKLPTIVHHDFSLKTKKSCSDECFKRYEIMIPDFIRYCQRRPGRVVLGMLKILGWGFREARTYKDPSFIRRCVSLGLKEAKGSSCKSR